MLQFKHSPDALENIRDWVQEDITDWAPQGEQALRRHIVTLMYGDDDDEKIRAVRVYTDVCEMQMMLGSHLFADEAQAMQTNPGIAAVLHQLHIGTDDQDAYGLADAVHQHLNSAEDLSLFGSQMQAARDRMQDRSDSEL